MGTEALGAMPNLIEPIIAAQHLLHTEVEVLAQVLALRPRQFAKFLGSLRPEDQHRLQHDIRVILALTKPAAWCTEYLPNAFPLPFGAHHQWLLEVLGPAPRGLRAFGGAPRGSGKTSVALFANPIRVMAIGSHRYLVILAVEQDQANSRLDMIAKELEKNARLVSDYPNLRIIRSVEGELELAGGIIRARGAGTSVRGLIEHTDSGELIRPDLFMFDDLETPEQARSKLRTDRLEEWLMADISNLGGPGEVPSLDIVGIGTTLEADALASRALKRTGRFAGWTVASFPAEYRDPVTNVRVAAWPEGQPLSRLDKLLTPGSETFIGAYTYSKEFLLDPMDREDATIKKAYLRYRKPPEGLGYRSLGIDPASSTQDQRRGDYSALVEVGIDPEGYVYVTRTWRGWVSKRELFNKAEDWTTHHYLGQRVLDGTIAYEAVAGFKWGVDEMRERGLSFRAVNPGGSDKLERLQRIALMYQAGVIYHAPELEGSDFEAELLSFPGAHDDFVDALVYAVLHCTNAGRRQRRVAEDLEEKDSTPESIRQAEALQLQAEQREARARAALEREATTIYDDE